MEEGNQKDDAAMLISYFLSIDRIMYFTILEGSTSFVIWPIYLSSTIFYVHILVWESSASMLILMYVLTVWINGFELWEGFNNACE